MVPTVIGKILLAVLVHAPAAWPGLAGRQAGYVSGAVRVRRPVRPVMRWYARQEDSGPAITVSRVGRVEKSLPGVVEVGTAPCQVSSSKYCGSIRRQV